MGHRGFGLRDPATWGDLLGPRSQRPGIHRAPRRPHSPMRLYVGRGVAGACRARLGTACPLDRSLDLDGVLALLICRLERRRRAGLARIRDRARHTREVEAGAGRLRGRSCPGSERRIVSRGADGEPGLHRPSPERERLRSGCNRPAMVLHEGLLEGGARRRISLRRASGRPRQGRGRLGGHPRGGVPASWHPWRLRGMHLPS
mmetsp:Transcript_32181/g.92654  ORF Transcript_32181/g.92654 Transcript_32181/m.92654 type:complete len:203 (+) Transcript_32181:155-763(+)